MTKPKKKRTPDVNLTPSSIHLEEISVTHQHLSGHNCSAKRSSKSSFEKGFSRDLPSGVEWLPMESTSAQVRHSIHGSPIFHRMGQIRPVSEALETLSCLHEQERKNQERFAYC